MKKQLQEQKPHYYGHRERLRTRLLESKKGTFAEYELLELLLCLAKPRGDVKPLAKELLQEYNNLAGVLSADPALLRRHTGVGDAVIAALRVVQESAIHLIKEDMMERPVLQSWKSLVDYCRASMGHHKTEQFRVLFLNTKCRVIADELQETGTINQTPLYPREVVKRALFLEASSIILVHNHPTGDTKPSRADIELTKQVIQAAAVVGVEVHDHVIVSQKSHYSFKAHHLM